MQATEAPNFQNLKKKFLCVSWFSDKNLSNLIYSVWKLHNPYCHKLQSTLPVGQENFIMEIFTNFFAINLRSFPANITLKAHFKNLKTFCYIITIYRAWQYRLWSFQIGGTKVERFLLKNQHIQRKFLNFEFWINCELSKIGHHFND